MRIGLNLLLITSLVCVTAGPARAGAREQGYKLYKAGQYKQAIVKFLAAHRQQGEAGLLYNVAKCYEKLANYREAVKYYQSYLLATRDAPDRKDVEAIIASLQSRMKTLHPEVEINSSPPGAKVHVDDNFVGETPLTLRLPPGNRRLKFTLAGYEPRERLVQVRTGASARVAVLLSPVKRTGSIKVFSDVKGARVLLNGKLIGLAPMTEGYQVSAGLQQIELEMKGYDRWIKMVQVQRGGDQMVYAQLESSDKPTSKKAIFGFIALGLAVVAEGFAWYFFARGNGQYQGSDEFELSRNMAMALHIGAGVGAAASAALLTWWLVGDKRSRSSQTNAVVFPTPTGAALGIPW